MSIVANHTPTVVAPGAAPAPRGLTISAKNTARRPCASSPPPIGQNQRLHDPVRSRPTYDASATSQCRPEVTGPWSDVKQLPCCTSPTLWANAIGGRRLVAIAPGDVVRYVSCTSHRLRPAPSGYTRTLSKPTRSATWRPKKSFRSAVEVPAAHSVVPSAWATEVRSPGSAAPASVPATRPATRPATTDDDRIVARMTRSIPRG